MRIEEHMQLPSEVTSVIVTTDKKTLILILQVVCFHLNHVTIFFAREDSKIVIIFKRTVYVHISSQSARSKDTNVLKTKHQGIIYDGNKIIKKQGPTIIRNHEKFSAPL